MDTYYLLVIIGTLVGFCALAFALLAPIYRFLDREEEVSQEWTKQRIAERQRRRPPSSNGSEAGPKKAGDGENGARAGRTDDPAG